MSVLVEVETPVPKKAAASDDKTRAPKAKTMLGCMTTLEKSN